MDQYLRDKSPRRWKFSQGLLSWAFISAFFACSYSEKASRKLLEAAADNPYDLIIVPGVPFENNKWGRTMKGRVYWSKYLFDRGIGKNIMYSGNAVYTPYFEGEIMALYAQAIGIPPKHIFTELKAEHSTENIYYSYQKAKKLGFERIALASDPFQTRLLEGFARKKINPEIGILPMVIDTLDKMDPEMIDPKIDFEKAFKPEFVSIIKRENIWKRMKGTRGKNIDTSAYK